MPGSLTVELQDLILQSSLILLKQSFIQSQIQKRFPVTVAALVVSVHEVQIRL